MKSDGQTLSFSQRMVCVDTKDPPGGHFRFPSLVSS